MPPATACCQPTSGCQDFYEQEWVRRLAGDCFHPGGAMLTRRTVAALGLKPGAAVLDLGCGVGASTLLLERDMGYRTTGVDCSIKNIEYARQRTQAHGQSQPTFVTAEATSLPFAADTFDAALLECTLSLFGEPKRALGELRRVLRPHGAVGLTDMAINGDLPTDVAEVVAPWACLQGALRSDQCTTLFQHAGFEIRDYSDESDCLLATLVAVKRQLLILHAGAAAGGIAEIGFDLANIRHWLGRMRALVEQGHIQYLRYALVKA